MGRTYNEKSAANEKEYPNVVEVAVSSEPLDVELSRRIILFHRSRHVKPRHGQRATRKNQLYYRWCFSDLATARDFLEHFGGALVENSLVPDVPQ